MSDFYKDVKELLQFRDLFPKVDHYMKEVVCLPQVDVESNPLYEVDVDNDVLFSTKLVYFCQRLKNEINKHINEKASLIEEKDSYPLTSYILKITRESVITLMHDANDFLEHYDNDDLLWKEMLSDNPSFREPERTMVEKVVFMHYAFAELTRCWLELQDRYRRDVGHYSAALFYSSCVHRFPDKAFEVKATQNNSEGNKKNKKCHPDCCFLYDNKEFFNVAMQGLTSKLLKFEFIPDDIDVKTLESLFRGKPCRYTYMWIGPTAVLAELTRKLCDEKDPVISTWPNGTSIWDVIKTRFKLPEGKSLENIRTFKATIKQKETIKSLVSELKDWLK